LFLFKQNKLNIKMQAHIVNDSGNAVVVYQSFEIYNHKILYSNLPKLKNRLNRDRKTLIAYITDSFADEITYVDYLDPNSSTTMDLNSGKYAYIVSLRNESISIDFAELEKEEYVLKNGSGYASEMKKNLRTKLTNDYRVQDPDYLAGLDVVYKTWYLTRKPFTYIEIDSDRIYYKIKDRYSWIGLILLFVLVVFFIAAFAIMSDVLIAKITNKA
tara:strand:- start:1153 stop:1797 length:645 start_codon:yes stop_codon:yes gene_type:complete